jgi:hypothetical protein
LADALDVFYATHSVFDKPRWTASAVAGAKNKPPRPPPPVKSSSVNVRTAPSNRSAGEKPSVKRCFTCGSDQHLANFHSRSTNSKPARVYRCQVERTDNVSSPNAEGKSGVASAETPVAAEVPVTSSAGKQAEPTVTCNELVVESPTASDVNKLLGASACDSAQCMLAPLDYLKVNVSDGHSVVEIDGLCDSGAQMCVVRRDAIGDLDLSPVGKVRIRGILGPAVEAQVVKVNMRLARCSDACANTPVTCAVAQEVNDRFVLSTEVINRLIEHASCGDVCLRSVRPERSDDNGGEGSGVGDDDGDEDEGLSGVEDRCADVEVSISTGDDTATLRDEQAHDETLRPCFALAKQGKGNFYLREGLLYKHETIVGEACEQLVLPLSRRDQVLQLAHDTCGGHMGVKNTKERIRLSFFWPTLARSYLMRLTIIILARTVNSLEIYKVLH